jgi:hypothetical protein
MSSVLIFNFLLKFSVKILFSKHYFSSLNCERSERTGSGRPGSGSGSPTLQETTEPQAVLRIRDVYPGSLILIFTHPGSRITDLDPKTATKERGEEKFLVIPLYEATNFTKL